MRRPTKNKPARQPQARTNQQIRASKLRVISEDGENWGIIPTAEALKKAQEAELDLIEISPKAEPPVAKIMDFGKYLYDEKKKRKQQKAKAHTVETKSVQIKPATGEHDLEMKAKRVSNWLKKGHRVKVELYLRGRAKYMNREFLEERLQRLLDLVSEEYKIAQEPQKSPKGLVTIIEKA